MVSRDKDAVSFYLNAAGKIPLLTAAEEIELGRKVQAFMQLLETNPDGPYDLPQKRIVRNGKRAKERMILANLRLVMVLAKKYAPRCRHLAMEDLLQEGVIGLVRGVEKFDPEKGYKFSTYAYWWIRQGVARAVAQLDRTIRLPSNAMDCLIKARYFIPRFQAEHGRVPTVEEIATECGVTPLMMEHYLKHTSDTSSLDTQCQGKEGEGSALLDLIADHTQVPWDYVERESVAEHQAALHKATHELPPMQQQVVQLRFSLDDGAGIDFFPRSQSRVAEMLGVSRQAISEHERKALNKLRLQLATA